MSKAPVLVGGPLLGERNTFTKTNNAQIPKDLKSWRTFEPLVTPVTTTTNEEQFVLLPSGAFVSVLAYKTGRRVATFIPFMENEEISGGNNMIESACLTTFPSSSSHSQQSVTDALRKLGNDADDTSEEDEQQGDLHVLLVGCRDGTIREFDLSVLTRKQRGQAASSMMSCGDYEIPGPCHRPRRVLVVTENQPIKHLTAPSNVTLKNGDALVYALSEKSALAPDGGKSKLLSCVHSSLLRVQLPPFHRKEHSGDKITALNDEAHDSEPRVVVQDTLKCNVGYDKEQRYNNTVPFRLLSASRKASRTFSEQDGQEDRDVFVVIARSTKFYIYHERIKLGEATQPKMQSTSFPTDRINPLSSISIAPNGKDVTCGYMEGEMCVMSDALPQTLDYFQHISEGKEEAPPHPCTTVLTRRVHWHAHPVTSLAYQGVSGGAVDPMLYSGGFESVLVTWQLSRGTYRPADVLPRLAKGGIVHVSCSEQEGGILVYCEDNSLQLFAAHNKSRLWKVQGLASSTGDSLGSSNARIQPTIRADSPSGSNTLILSGLPSAPGYLHWYDIREQRVTAQLEVAPFNRVSRTEHDDTPMPVPSVTNCAFSESGRDLVTVDTMPTENSGIGATERLSNGSSIGVVSTVRFWSWNSTDKMKSPKAGPYSLTAAMTYPHGEENRVTAIAISKDGQYACTVSNDDNAFRLWHKVLSENTNEQDVDGKSRRTPVWLCRFKVTTPSGYSNFPTGSNAASFSSDGSILAICYGNMITLWDHKEATLLTALQHLDDDRAPVESLSFVKTGFLNDLILTRSRSGVTLQNPYGKGKDSWSCTLPVDYKDASVTHAELIPRHDSVAVCMSFHKKKAQSHVLLLDAVTGAPRTSSQNGETKPMVWELPGTIRSIGAQGKPTKSSNWVDVGAVQKKRPKNDASPVRLYVTMSNGDMVLLSTDGGAHSVDTVGGVYGKSARTATDAPRLNMLTRGDGRKRKREQANLAVNSLDAPLKKRSMGSIFGASFGEDDAESAPLPSSDLPALGGAFTRAFVSRNLVSNRQASS